MLERFDNDMAKGGIYNEFGQLYSLLDCMKRSIWSIEEG